jgi:hypothetical protein
MDGCATASATLACSVRINGVIWEGMQQSIPFATITASVGYGSQLDVTNGLFKLDGSKSSILSSAKPTNAPTYVRFANNHLSITSGTVYVLPLFSVAEDVEASIVDNRVTPKGAGAGTFWSFTTDEYHMGLGNIAPGWTCTTPAVTNATYANNKC